MTQSEQILSALKKGKTVSALEALLQFNCLRLAARIRDLRNQGYRIKTHLKQNGRKRWAVYSLVH